MNEYIQNYLKEKMFIVGNILNNIPSFKIFFQSESTQCELSNEYQHDRV